MKKVLIAVLLTVMIIGNVAAIDIKYGKEPASWGGTLTQEIKDKIQAEVDKKYGKYEDSKDVGKAMSNANALAASSGYMHSANGYNLFSVAVSGMVAGAVGSVSEIDDFIDTYKDDGDVYFGLGGQIINATVGFNVGRLFKWDHALYLTLKGGLTKFKVDEFDIDAYNLGFMVNYQLLEDVNLTKKGAIKWRGLNVGAGYTYYSSTMEWTVDKLDTLNINAGGHDFKYDADLNVKSENTRHLIPVEITTGIKLAIVELFGGLGADFMFGGDNEITADSDAKVRLVGNDDPTNAKMHFSCDGDEDSFKMKFMVGIGFSLGPVHIEIPYTQYFDEKLNSCIGVIGGVAF